MRKLNLASTNLLPRVTQLVIEGDVIQTQEMSFQSLHSTVATTAARKKKKYLGKCLDKKSSSLEASSQVGRVAKCCTCFLTQPCENYN